MVNLDSILNKTNIFFEKNNQFDQFKICTDSRSFQEGDAFLAIIGENFDGIDYLENVLIKGCPLAVYSSQSNKENIDHYKRKYSGTSFLEVNDSISFLKETASRHIQSWRNKENKIDFVITGSNGKTTTKDMLSHILSKALGEKVFCTPGNFNNHIGLPLSILQLRDHHEVAVFEIGTNHPGEIAYLCRMINPTHGYITSIGDSHLEFFKNRDNVFIEKSDLYESIKSNNSKTKFFLINNNDEYLCKLEKTNFCQSIGQENSDVILSFKPDGFEMSLESQSFQVKNDHLIGEHNFQNLAAAFVLASKVIKPDLAIEGCRDFIPNNNRSSWVKYKSSTVFLDAYNANPSSMECSLKGFIHYLKTKKIHLFQALFILGDMNELGDNAQKMHVSIGSLLSELGVEKAYFIGKHAGDYAFGFKGEHRQFSCVDDLDEQLLDPSKHKFNFVFIKGSNSLKLERLLKI